MAAPKQTDPQFKLRLTPELKAQIEQASDDSGRSMNAEIVARLEQSFFVPEEDYKTLAEAALASLEDAAENSRRELREYQVMSSQIRLLRHVVGRLASLHADMPPDLATLVHLLGVTEIKDVGLDDRVSSELLSTALIALEDLETLEADLDGEEGARRAMEREEKMDAARRIAQKYEAAAPRKPPQQK